MKYLVKYKEEWIEVKVHSFAWGKWDDRSSGITIECEGMVAVFTMVANPDKMKKFGTAPLSELRYVEQDAT